MGRRRLAAICIAAVVAGVVAVIGASPAFAACHAFIVEASPETANEGQTVTVTVTRDAAVNPSSVEVSSVDGTAKGGQDFPAVKRTIEFTAETSQTFTIVITDDPDPEPEESFKLHLSNGGGCAINDNFTYGPDATVAIAANDSSNTTAPPPTAGPTTTAARTSPTTGASTTTAAPDETTTSAAVVPDESSTTLRTDDAAAGSDDDDSSSAGAIIAVLVVLAAIAALGAYLFARRRGGPDRGA